MPGNENEKLTAHSLSEHLSPSANISCGINRLRVVSETTMGASQSKFNPQFFFRLWPQINTTAATKTYYKYQGPDKLLEQHIAASEERLTLLLNQYNKAKEDHMSLITSRPLPDIPQRRTCNDEELLYMDPIQHYLRSAEYSGSSDYSTIYCNI